MNRFNAKLEVDLISGEDVLALRAALAQLDPIIADTDVSQIRVAMDCLRLRAALELGPPPAMSALATCLATLDDANCDAGALEDAVSALDASVARVMLQTAARYVTPARSVVLDDVLARRAIVPEPRLAALLAVAEPARCEALLARVHAAEPWAHVDAVAAAYLALVDRGREIPRTLSEHWSAIVEAPDEYPSPERHSARLRGLARGDAGAALPALAEAFSHVSVEEIPLAVMAVLSRAVARDHASAWSLGTGLTSIHPRALAIEALATGAPASRELEAAVDDVLGVWRRGGWQVDTSELGVFQISTPLLGACAVSGRLDIARRVIDAFELSVNDIAASMVAGTRLRFARTGGWRPGDHSNQLTDPTIDAAWTIETLPVLDLPWVDYVDCAR